MKKRFLNKKGVTMVETIIAIFIVCLVTVAAVSLFMSSITTTQSAIYKAQALNFAEDALTCFRATDSADRFNHALVINGGFSDYQIIGKQYTFILSNSGYKAVAWVDYPADGRATFSIQITDKDGTAIVHIPEFKKGA